MNIVWILVGLLSSVRFYSLYRVACNWVYKKSTSRQQATILIDSTILENKFHKHEQIKAIQRINVINNVRAKFVWQGCIFHFIHITFWRYIKNRLDLCIGRQTSGYGRARRNERADGCISWPCVSFIALLSKITCARKIVITYLHCCNKL